MSSGNPLGDLIEAVNFAAQKHITQKRKGSGSPYIVHPVGVARSIYHEGGVGELDVLQAAVLHDTVEDTGTTFAEIEEHFGPAVRRIVEEVTDDKSLSPDARKRAQVEHGKHASRAAKLVKLADKLYNLRDLLVTPPPTWDERRIQGYFVWAKKVTDGMRGTNSGLEAALDEVFKARFRYQERTFPVLPEGDLEDFLEAYYKFMSTRS